MLHEWWGADAWHAVMPRWAGGMSKKEKSRDIYKNKFNIDPDFESYLGTRFKHGSLEHKTGMGLTRSGTSGNVAQDDLRDQWKNDIKTGAWKSHWTTDPVGDLGHARDAGTYTHKTGVTSSN